jgi:hypothetical protein
MVPSWTETLIEAGVEVVGRTRFCIHPQEKVKSIPVVGGTKDINWEKIKAIDFDFLVLDKEENPKEMADKAQSKVIATHVKRCDDVVTELQDLAIKLKNEKLNDFAKRWKAVLDYQGTNSQKSRFNFISSLPKSYQSLESNSGLHFRQTITKISSTSFGKIHIWQWHPRLLLDRCLTWLGYQPRFLKLSSRNCILKFRLKTLTVRKRFFYFLLSRFRFIKKFLN